MEKSSWSKQDIRILKKMMRQGFSHAEIAKELGRTVGAVTFRKHKLKVEEGFESVGVTGWSEAEVLKMEGMTQKGVATEEIAKVLGRTNAAVRLKRHSIKKHVPQREDVGEKEQSVKDNAKTLASVARQIARANGKRITMAMFFVEDL